MKFKIVFAIGLLLSLFKIDGIAQKRFEVKSPDKKTTLSIAIGEKITYSVSYNKDVIVAASPVSMVINSDTLCKNAQVSKSSAKKINEQIVPLYGKFKSLPNQCNELTLDFANNFSLVFRAYNEGVAYRFVTRIKGTAIVNSEESNVILNGHYSALWPETPKLTSWELSYVKYDDVAKIENSKMAILPSLFSNTNNGLRVIVAESDLRDYPGMFLMKNGNGFHGLWAKYPKKTTPYGGEWGMSTSVDERENYIAKTNGTREFPWRIIMVSDDDKKLLTNELIYKLATSQLIDDVSWIKLGKCDWEWWHDAIVKDAGFPTGFANRSTKLYKLYIDFAATNKLEYTLIDAGWSNFYKLDTPAAHIDIQELVNYGKQKNVGLIVWCNATSLLADPDRFMAKFQQWGIKGFKVDFFDRDDQIIIKQMEEIAAKAAKYHLLIDFHGCPKPTGLQRAYPNILTYEAVRGEECSKWDLSSNPEYHVQVAFIRMLGGSLDCTPGSMRNRSKDKFKPIAEGLPETQGTRCHEMSMFVIYDQYLPVFCDSPEEYRKYPDIMNFFSKLPLSFDETKALDGKLSDYAVIAKRKDNDWYVGAMTNWDSRDMKIDLSFLDKKKKYKAEIFKDGTDAGNNAESYLHETVEVTKSSVLNLHLASGGGAAIRIYPAN